MTTPTHDPLNARHLELLSQAPFEITVHEQTHGPDSQALGFLQMLGLLSPKIVHVSQNPGNSTVRYERTAKAVD